MSPTESQHVAVLADEVIAALALKVGQIVVDGTLGGGGHRDCWRRPWGRRGGIALDRDPNAVARAERELDELPVQAFQANYCDLPEL